MSTASAVVLGSVGVTARLALETWRCRGCRRILARLEYDGGRAIEVKCKCNCANRLPEDAAHLRLEFPPRA